MRTIVEGIVHAQRLSVLGHFFHECAYVDISVELRMLHQLFPLQALLMGSFGKDGTSSLDDHGAEVLSKYEGGIVTTWQHHSIEELLQGENVALDELGGSSDDLGGNWRDSGGVTVDVEAELVDELDRCVEGHHLGYTGNLASHGVVLSRDQLTSATIVDGPA